MSAGNRYKEHWLRCNECRTRRSSIQALLAHRREHPECKPCTCEGYPFVHRPGSPYCTQNPRAPLRHALRAAETDEDVLDILVEWAWEGEPTGVGGECPF